MKNNDLPDHDDLNSLASFFVILTISISIAHHISGAESVPAYWDSLWIILFYLSVFPLIEIQEKINILKNDPLGNENAKYSKWQILILVIGGLVWLMIFFGLIIMSIIPNEV
jgi:hypothetical protein